MKRITDKGFRYVPSYETNIRRTFDRIKAQQKKQTEAKVLPIVRPKVSHG